MMATLQDMSLTTCLKSDIPIYSQYVDNGISYDHFTEMIRKHDKPKWDRIIETINRSKLMMVAEAMSEGWSAQNW